MKKKIKIKLYVGKNIAGIQCERMEDFFPTLSFDKYDFVYTEKPDYVIFSSAEIGLDYFKHDCIRIDVQREIVVPDFNVCDYAVSCMPILFGDRHCVLPICMAGIEREVFNPLLNINRKFEISDMKAKDKFCNFIYSNGGASRERKELFDLVSRYKHVDAAGMLFNNIGYRLGNTVAAKIEFQQKTKFTLAIENVYVAGGATEKLIHAFQANTIPIYWGDPVASQIFNDKAYIDCEKFKNPKDLLAEIKRLDQDDEAYIAMLNQPILNPNFQVGNYDLKLQQFLENIFDQDLLKAGRRIKVLRCKWHTEDLFRGSAKRARKNRLKSCLQAGLKRMGLEAVTAWMKKIYNNRKMIQ